MKASGYVLIACNADGDWFGWECERPEDAATAAAMITHFGGRVRCVRLGGA